MHAVASPKTPSRAKCVPPWSLRRAVPVPLDSHSGRGDGAKLRGPAARAAGEYHILFKTPV